MKLFTVGPVEMYEHTLRERGKQLPYFRTEQFSTVMMEIEERLKRIMKTSSKSKCAIITGSGSAAMESVVSNSLDKNDNVLIINGGSFGRRFVELCEIYSIPFDELIVPFDEQLSEKHFESHKEINYTAMLVNLHETSTGQLYNIELLSKFCKQHGMKLIVDAISTFLSDEYDMDGNGIDCTIVSSQKALALAPGLSMIVMNQTFYKEKVEGKPPINLYLNIQSHVENLKRGQTPNTPAVGICYELLDMLRKIEKNGVETKVQNTAIMANHFRLLVSHTSIKIPEFTLSNTLTPLYFENGGARKIYDYLKNNYDIYVTPSGGDLSDKLLRIGHMGNVQIEYYDELIKYLKEAL